jgi:hypothetical protein
MKPFSHYLKEAAKAAASGDLFLEFSRQCFVHNEWGMARKYALIAIEQGNLSSAEEAQQLLEVISQRMWS